MTFKRRYGVGSGADIDVPLIKRGVVDFAVGADYTPSAGDVKVSKDGGAAANIGTLPTAVAMGNGAYWKFVFSDSELTCKRLIVTVADSATKSVEDQAFIIETFGHASAMYKSDIAGGRLTFTVVSGGTTGGFVSDRTETANDYWKDCFIKFTSGALINQVRQCTGYNGSTKAFSVTDLFTSSPANGVTGEIIND